MDWAHSWPWMALALLGAYHGLNPGMGWLFAVARGLQEGSRGAVLASLVPILVGHEASVVVMASAALAVYQVVGLRILRRSWFNLDLVWAASLAAAGLITMFS